MPAKKKISSALTLESSPGMLAENTLPGGFIDIDDFVPDSGMIVKSMSPLIAPADFPVGKVFVGIFTKMFETTPSPKKKGEGVEIVPVGAAMGIAVPAVATIRQGLDIKGEGAGASSPYLGRKISIQKMPQRLKSKKGQAAWHFIIGIFPAEKAAN